MNVIVVKDYQEMSEKAFEIVLKLITEKNNAVLGLATGSSPVGLYQLMVKDHQQNHTSYQDIVTFNLDEYIGLDKHHPQTYYTFMHQNLFDHIDIKPENVHIPNGSASDIEAEAKAYEAALNQAQLDFQLLGIGSNGHIGFNEPYTPFDSVTGVVNLTERTIKDNARFFDNDINKVPTQAISMGIASIMKAKKILVLASGLKKADAIYGMVHGKVDESLPASILQNHNDVTVIIDEQAASKLK